MSRKKVEINESDIKKVPSYIRNTQKRYYDKAYKMVNLKFRYDSDMKVIDKLENVENKKNYIKRLIEKDLKKEVNKKN